MEKEPPRAWTRPAQGRSRGHVGGGRSAMLEVQEPVVEPGLVVRRLKEPMLLMAVEGDRSALCLGSWGWGAILGVVAPMVEEAAAVELERVDVGWPRRLGGEPPCW